MISFPEGAPKAAGGPVAEAKRPAPRSNRKENREGWVQIESFGLRLENNLGGGGGSRMKCGRGDQEKLCCS